MNDQVGPWLCHLLFYTVREILMASILGWFAIPSSSGSCFVRDLVDAEEIKKRWKYMEELYKQDLNEPDYSDGVASHQEPDILECEVKWALRSTAVNKASGCDGISADLFKPLKEDAIKVLHSLCQQIWKIQQWPQEWKGQSSSQFPRRVIPKNVLTVGQLYSSPMLVRSCLKSFRLDFNMM